MTDSVQIIRDTIYIANPDLLDTVTKVDGFYNNLWTAYTTIFGLMGVLLGVVFPLIQSNIQKKSNEKYVKNIEDEINELKVFKRQVEEAALDKEIEGMHEILDDSYENEPLIRKIYLGWGYSEEYFNTILDGVKKRRSWKKK